MGPSGISPASSASIFQSTHPAWGGTTGLSLGSVFFCISIHPPRMGWDQILRRCQQTLPDFNPPTPHGSIHPPRMGWDQILRRCQQTLPDFNPPTPHGVGPPVSLLKLRYLIPFQSTHPAWGGTGEIGGATWKNRLFQSTHPAWGGTAFSKKFFDFIKISIHPPRMGWHFKNFVSKSSGPISIHPPRMGWDFRPPDKAGGYLFISIHPPRMGWDNSRSKRRVRNYHFNPPTPHGVGPSVPPQIWTKNDFNPPTPHGVGRSRMKDFGYLVLISIHPPRMGWDGRCYSVYDLRIRFQSTHPAWGGTAGRIGYIGFRWISIHPPRMGWDQNFWQNFVN